MPGRFLFALPVALATAAPAPAPAETCRTIFDRTEYYHRTLPPLPPNAAAAQVEIVRIARPGDPTYEARVISMVRGRYRGTRIRFALRHLNDCDVLPTLGDRGLMAGRILAISNDLLVIDPIRAPSANERRRHGEPEPVNEQ